MTKESLNATNDIAKVYADAKKLHTQDILRGSGNWNYTYGQDRKLHLPPQHQDAKENIQDPQDQALLFVQQRKDSKNYFSQTHQGLSGRHNEGD
jgi:hypothetical protein